jgi:hypothetical protein
MDNVQWLTDIHRAQPIFRWRHLRSYSVTSQHFMEPKISLPCSQEPSTGPYPEPDQPIPPNLTYLSYIVTLSSHLCLGLPSGLFPSGFPTNSHMHSSSPFVLHALVISSALTWSFSIYLAKSTSYKPPHYTVFFNLLSLHLSSVQIFSSAPCSQTSSFCVPTLMSHTKFHTHIQSHRQNYSFVYSNFYVSRQWTRRRKLLDWKVAIINRIHSPLNFLPNQIFIYYCRSQIYELCHTLKEFDSSHLVIILPCILVTRQQHILSFL